MILANKLELVRLIQFVFVMLAMSGSVVSAFAFGLGLTVYGILTAALVVVSGFGFFYSMRVEKQLGDRS
jgi:hypothetical protein